MAKPSLDDLIDSVRKGPAPDPKKVAAEKKKKAAKEALKNVPVAQKKSRAQRDKESSDSFISKAKKAVSDGRKKEVARKKSEDTLAKKTRSRELVDKKKSLEAKKSEKEARGRKAAAELGSAKTTNVSSNDSSAEAGTKMLGNALSTVGAGARAAVTASGAGEKANRLKKRVMQRVKKNRGLKTGVSSTQSIKDRNAKKKEEKSKDPWNESMDWRDNYIPTEIETTDIIKPEPLKASNWREDFLWEVEKYPKEKKEKEIKPMTGKNTVIINPRIDEGIRLKTKDEFMQGLNNAKKRWTDFTNWLVPPAKDSNEPSVRAGERTPNTGGINQPHIPSRGKDGRRYGSEDDGSVAPPKSTEKDTRTPDQKTTPADRAKPTKPTKPAVTPKATTPAPAASSTPKDRGPRDYGSKEANMAAWAKANPKLAAAAKERARTRGTNQTTNPLMKDMKSRMPAPKGSSPASTASSTPKVTPAPKVKPQRIPVQPFRSPSRGTTTNPGSRFKSVTPMRLTNSFSNWRSELQLDEEAEKRYCPKCDKVETKSECSFGPKYWEENAKKVDTQEESYTIDPKAHRKNQRAAKIRTLSKKGATEGERSAAERKTKGPKMFGEGAAWTKKEGKNSAGGLNEKGRKSYERDNPGSDLKAPSKKVGNPRRASFCARMKGMKKKLTSKKTASDPDSRINKSLRAWNC